MKAYLIYILVILFALTGCTSSSSDNESDRVVLMKDIQPYMQQWDDNKEQITRLSGMEEDLSLLIQALAVQTKIETLPEQLQDDIKDVKYELSPEDAASGAFSAVEKVSVFYGGKLGSYLNQKRAQAQVNAILSQYAQMSSVLRFRLNKKEKGTLTLYDLIAGPVMSLQEAKQLCVFFNQIGQTCMPSKFVGEPIKAI